MYLYIHLNFSKFSTSLDEVIGLWTCQSSDSGKSPGHFSVEMRNPRQRENHYVGETYYRLRHVCGAFSSTNDNMAVRFKTVIHLGLPSDQTERGSCFSDNIFFCLSF